MNSISKLSYEDNEAVALMPVSRDAQFYKMNHRNRGIAVILWHENFQNNLFKRQGANLDVENLEKPLMKLGFSVEFHKDLTVSEIMHVLNRVSNKDHSDNDCFLLVCLTFGNQSVLHAFDSLYDPRILIRDFTADNCPSLAGKPKLFWIQASPLNQDGTDILRRVQFDSAASYKIPVQADFLISYSCIPDFLHSDGKTRSSWFIQALSGMLEKYSSSEDMLLLCTQINYKASPLNQDGTDILRRVQFDSAASYKIPVQADFLISYSCIPDFLHSDGKTRSSWFIQALSGMLEKYSSSEDMLLPCTQINYKASPLNQDGTDILRRVQFDSAASYKIPVQADFLISYSCIPDFLHSDGKTRSSWFIQALSGMLEKYSSSEDMLLLCTQINYKVVANMKSYNTYNPDNQIKIQALCHSSMLIRKLQFPENIQMSNIGMKENTEDSTQERFYNMNHKKRGIAVILSHTHFQTSREPRKGNATDVSLLKNTFMKLGFKVIHRHDLTYDEINAFLKKVRERDHSKYDCFVLVCLTHGKDTAIESSDNPYNPNRLWDNFTDEKCPGLVDKPRMFFLQLCRGNQFDSGVKLHFSLQAQAHSGKQVNCGVLVNSQETFEPYNLPTDPDFLIAFATSPGYVSWRHPLKGSYFIKALCETLNEYVYTEDMLALLTRVNRKVAVNFESYKADPDKHGRKQMPCITSMLTRKLKFTRKRN